MNFAKKRHLKGLDSQKQKKPVLYIYRNLAPYTSTFIYVWKFKHSFINKYRYHTSIQYRYVPYCKKVSNPAHYENSTAVSKMEGRMGTVIRGDFTHVAADIAAGQGGGELTWAAGAATAY